MLLISLHEFWHDFQWGNGWFIFPMVIMSLFIILIIISLFRKNSFVRPWFYHYDDFRPRGRSSETALQILKKRYAKGEIEKDEFDRIKLDLMD